ncbi:hypothetical protein lerEdw1_006210 [Lerista edwardsae]|nr:hypothetical protein lerEdw1_006210 [Lerista edwardsae]
MSNFALSQHTEYEIEFEIEVWADRAEHCNKTWHFNISEVEDIMGDMKQYWPDVLHPNHTQLWKHEWEKHGTCVAMLDSLNSEKKYFSKALEFYEKLDLNSYLLKVGIKPGNNYYQLLYNCAFDHGPILSLNPQLSTIRDALTSFYKVTPKIQCLPPEEGEEVQTIGQIKFCFTKEFNLMNCTESQAVSYLAHEDRLYNPEELSICNDTLLYYPAQLPLHK